LNYPPGGRLNVKSEIIKKTKTMVAVGMMPSPLAKNWENPLQMSAPVMQSTVVELNDSGGTLLSTST
jgi:hypothetical protein